MILRLSIFCILTSLYSLSAFARTDAELRDSQKCSSLFSYFEKKHNLPKDTLHAVSLQETGKKHSKYNIILSWPWTINVGGKGYYFKTKKEAVAFTKKTLARGKKSIDIGCMQVNLKYHPDAFESIEDAFSPRKNIAYSADLISKKYKYLGSIEKAIGHYHSATAEKSKRYQLKVKKISAKMREYKNKFRQYAIKSRNTTSSAT